MEHFLFSYWNPKFISSLLIRISHGRRGEEHSFILKPATSLWKNLKAGGDRRTQTSQLQAGNAASSLRPPSKAVELKRSASTADQYAIMVSCRCNYTGNYIPFSVPYLENLSYLFLILLLLCYICRVEIIFQTANKLAATCFKGSYDLCCI